MSGNEPPPDERPDVPAEEAPLGAGIDFSDPNSPLAPYYLHSGHVVAAVLLGVLVLFYSILPLWHTDIWGHLAYGRWMSANRSLPERELFSPFADRDSAYVNFQWLSQVIFYQVYHAGEVLAGGDDLQRTGGGVALLRTVTTFFALAYYLLLLLAYRRRAGSLALACGGIVLALILSRTAVAVLRPQNFGQVLFAALLFLLARPAVPRRWLIVLPVLFVLWANLHGSFLVGLILLGVCLVGRVIETAGRPEGEGFRGALLDGDVRRLALALGLSALAAGLLNPHGPMLYLHVLELGRNFNVNTLDEWQPLSLTLGPGALVIYSVSVVALGVSYALARRRPSATEWLLILAFGLVPIMQRRMLIWWMPLVPWIVMRPWAALAERIPALRGESTLSFIKTIMVALLVFAVLPWTVPARWLLEGGPASLALSTKSETPRELAYLLEHPDAEPSPRVRRLQEFLKEHYPDGRFTGSIFASETTGDYLVWALGDRWPVAIYTHVHLFPFHHWRDCLDVKFGRRNREEILNRLGVNLVVIEGPSHPHLYRELKADPDWVVVCEPGAPGAGGRPSPLAVAVRKSPLLP